MGDVVVRVFRQLEEGLHSQALVLMGHFNHPRVCWMDNTAGDERFKQFLECIDDNVDSGD